MERGRRTKGGFFLERGLGRKSLLFFLSSDDPRTLEGKKRATDKKKKWQSPCLPHSNPTNTANLMRRKGLFCPKKWYLLKKWVFEAKGWSGRFPPLPPSHPFYGTFRIHASNNLLLFPPHLKSHIFLLIPPPPQKKEFPMSKQFLLRGGGGGGGEGGGGGGRGTKNIVSHSYTKSKKWSEKPLTSSSFLFFESP